MNISDIPSDTNISIADFQSCDWKKCLASGKEERYTTMWKNFASAALEIDEKHPAQAKILWLFAFACSLKLVPERRHDPFEILNFGYNSNTDISKYFDSDVITFFSSILYLIDNNLLKARLADFVWVKNKKLGYGNALIAIDA